MAAEATGNAQLVFPLDVSSLDEARLWIERLKAHVGVFKVGLELFTSAGPKAVHAITEKGLRCFLDLKLHDIPATVAGAVRSAVDLDASYLTVHATSGRAALEAAAKAAKGSDLKLLAVTILTSLGENDLRAIGIRGTPSQAVADLGQLAVDSGLPGLVCSAAECRDLRAALGDDPLLVVPGIRPAGVSSDDQQRVATPESALDSGASLLVVGRPIRNAADPVEAAARIAESIRHARTPR